MSSAPPNTFNDPDYERRSLLHRVSTCREVMVARQAGIETALALAREGRVAVRWDGPFLIVRMPSTGPLPPAPLIA